MLASSMFDPTTVKVEVLFLPTWHSGTSLHSGSICCQAVSCLWPPTRTTSGSSSPLSYVMTHIKGAIPRTFLAGTYTKLFINILSSCLNNCHSRLPWLFVLVEIGDGKPVSSVVRTYLIHNRLLDVRPHVYFDFVVDSRWCMFATTRTWRSYVVLVTHVW